MQYVTVHSAPDFTMRIGQTTFYHSVAMVFALKGIITRSERLAHASQAEVIKKMLALLNAEGFVAGCSVNWKRTEILETRFEIAGKICDVKYHLPEKIRIIEKRNIHRIFENTIENWMNH